MASSGGSNGENGVRGRISFEPGAPGFEDATVRVRLEDTTVADAPARIVSEATLSGVALPSAGGTIPFLVPAGTAEAGRRYNLRVHVDRAGDGEVAEGDFVTTQSYPVVLGTDATVVVRSV